MDKKGIQLTTQQLVVIVLTIVVMLPLMTLSVKLFQLPGGSEESAITHFEKLGQTMRAMPDPMSFGAYPIFLDDYVLVGFRSGEDFIEGTCPMNGIDETVKIAKPLLCGGGTDGCVCLCDDTGDLGTLCTEDVVACYGSTVLGADLSYTGPEDGSCAFAMLYGTGKPQTISVVRSGDLIRLGGPFEDTNVGLEEEVLS